MRTYERALMIESREDSRYVGCFGGRYGGREFQMEVPKYDTKIVVEWTLHKGELSEEEQSDLANLLIDRV